MALRRMMPMIPASVAQDKTAARTNMPARPLVVRISWNLN